MSHTLSHTYASCKINVNVHVFHYIVPHDTIQSFFLCHRQAGHSIETWEDLMLATRPPGHSTSDTLSPQLRGTSAHLDPQQKMARSGTVWCMEYLCAFMKLFVLFFDDGRAEFSLRGRDSWCLWRTVMRIGIRI